MIHRGAIDVGCEIVCCDAVIFMNMSEEMIFGLNSKLHGIEKVHTSDTQSAYHFVSMANWRTMSHQNVNSITKNHDAAKCK